MSSKSIRRLPAVKQASQRSSLLRPALQTLESLERRQLLSFAAHVNFQPASVAVPAGYVADSGSSYGSRGNGFTYGWNPNDFNTVVRNSSLAPDKRYDTFDLMQVKTKNGHGPTTSYSWQIAVPNGTYQVHIVAGDPSATDSTYQINAEGTLVVSGTPTTANHWVEGYGMVTVLDGQLTITNGSGARNNKIDFIDIQQVVAPAPTTTLMGANLDGNFDWSTAHIWADAGHDFRQWGTVGEPWVPNPNLTFTSDDYPLQDADALSYLNDYPNGVYKLTWSGAGTMTAYGMASISNIVQNGTNWTADVTVTHDNADGTGGIMELGIRNNVATNPVHNIHLWQPGYGPGQTFTTDFMRRVEPFGSLRFMDWALTNNSTIVNWADRSQPTSMIQSLKGVDWEDVIALANQTKRDAWINIPAEASDDYVMQLATLVRNTLDPSLKVRIEYSNEVWNSAFQQFGYVVQQAWANPLLTATDDYTRAAQQYAYRSKQIGDIFRSVFGSQSSRLVPILGGQTSNTWWSSQGLAFINSMYGSPSQFFKELAIAPYVGDSLPPAPSGGWTLDSLFAALENFNSTTLASQLQAMKGIADTYALGFTAYEGGQALTGNSSVPTDLAMAANNDPRMYTLYHDMMAVWRQNGGGLYQQFSHIGGGWGLLDDIRLPGSYRWDAVMDMTLQKGDANLDGVVNYDDFLILQTNYGQPGKWWWEQGDFNGDGVVDRADLDLMYANLTGLTADQWNAVNAFMAANP